MNCETAREWMAESWAGELDNDRRAQLELHLRSCTACAEQGQSLQELWNALAEVPTERPGPDVRSRFYLMLDAYRLGTQQSRRQGSWLDAVSTWRIPRPVLQFAAAAALVVAGIFAGRWTSHERPVDDPRYAQLTQEVQNMRELVALSLMQQQSATDRLRGVNWAYRLDKGDSEVLDALIRTLNEDTNVNVRLSAVDALQRFASNAEVRTELRQSLPRQTSPLVQIALIDSMTEARDRAAVSVLDQLRGRADLDPAVKMRIERAIGRLQ